MRIEDSSVVLALCVGYVMKASKWDDVSLLGDNNNIIIPTV